MAKVQDNGLINLIKEIAVNAIGSKKPTSLLYGTVISIAPLSIKVSENLILSKEFLIVPKSLTDYEIDVEVDWNTEVTDTAHTHNINLNDRYNSIGDTENKMLVSEEQNNNKTHSHQLKGKKTIKIFNALKVNDKVVLVQAQGGQDFIILDKVG